MVPPGLKARIDLSLTDDEPYAWEIAIISAELAGAALTAVA